MSPRVMILRVGHRRLSPLPDRVGVMRYTSSAYSIRTPSATSHCPMTRCQGVRGFAFWEDIPSRNLIVTEVLSFRACHQLQSRLKDKGLRSTAVARLSVLSQ